MNTILTKAGEHGPIVFRATLYFIAAFLPALTEKIVEVLSHDKWPTPQRWTLSIIMGTSAAVVALRAYYDGSAQRNSDKIENGNHQPPPTPTPPPPTV